MLFWFFIHGMAPRCSVIANLFALRYVPHGTLKGHLFQHLLTNEITQPAEYSRLSKGHNCLLFRKFFDFYVTQWFLRVRSNTIIICAE